MGKTIYSAFLEKNNVEIDIPCCKDNPENMMENEIFTTYWDRTILIEEAIVHNKSDIMMVDKKQENAHLLDVFIPKKEKKNAEKINRLIITVKGQWSVERVKLTPIITLSTGITLTTLHKELEDLALTKLRNFQTKAMGRNPTD